MENNYKLLLLVIIPILGGIGSFYIGKKNKEKRNEFTGMVIATLLAILAAWIYLIMAKDVELTYRNPDWFGLGLYFVMDRVRIVLCFMLTWIYAIVAWFMKFSMKEKSNTNRFYLFYLFSLGTTLGTVMSDNLYNFFMFATITQLLFYPMIVHRQDPEELKNGTIYLSFFIAVVGMVTVGISIIFSYAGSLRYDGIYKALQGNGNNGILLLGSIIMLFACGIASGAFPLQYLVTRGTSYALLEASAIYTSIVTKFGLFITMILAGSLLSKNIVVGRIILVVGLLTIIWGLVLSMLATDIRKILTGNNLVMNGFILLGIGLMIVTKDADGYAMRGTYYMFATTALSLTMLYMVAMEQVCKVGKYEIKGLIGSGKENKLLAVVCLIACTNVGGVPGTFGFLAHAMLFKSIITDVKSNWLAGAYIILWAFLLTAFTRIFMKLFVSKKEETIHMMTTKEELDRLVEEEEEMVDDGLYFSGEFFLLVIGLAQIFVGVFPNYTIEKGSLCWSEFFHAQRLTGRLPYFSYETCLGFFLAAILAVILYVNLVHGILLRAIRNKKNKKLQKKCNEEQNAKKE